jgi:hypothetical protein
VLQATDDSWVAVFWVSAITLGAIGALCFFILKGSPTDVGLPLEEGEEKTKHAKVQERLEDLDDEGEGRVQVGSDPQFLVGGATAHTGAQSSGVPHPPNAGHGGGDAAHALERTARALAP